MEYANMVAGRFLSRPNRFIAQVDIQGQIQTCHVKNTGRCRELLVPGVRVWCQAAANPNRKTQFDLIAVEKGSRIINLDAQAPNQAAAQWLSAGGLGQLEDLRQEVTLGDSRFDFAFRKGGRQCYLEVKGVTLEENGVAKFPDAPTSRGAKHLRGLAQASAQGCGAYVLFVIQLRPVAYFTPNDATDPAFGQALRAAKAAGVELLAMDCQVTPQAMTIARPVEVRL